jgi:hypothetical protein
MSQALPVQRPARPLMVACLLCAVKVWMRDARPTLLAK